MLIFIDGYRQEISKQCILSFILKIIESKVMRMLVLCFYAMLKVSKNKLLKHFINTNDFKLNAEKE